MDDLMFEVADLKRQLQEWQQLMEQQQSQFIRQAQDHLHQNHAKESDQPRPRWIQRSGLLCCCIILFGLGAGCSWHLRELLEDARQSPTVTKINFAVQTQLPLPPITLYSENNPGLLDTRKMFVAMRNGPLTHSYLESTMKGLGVALSYESVIVSPADELSSYNEGILRHGSIVQAGLALQADYDLACDELFIKCDTVDSPKNCCDIFELLWGFGGRFYALKPNTIFSNTVNAFTLRILPSPKLEALEKNGSMEDVNNYYSFRIGMSSGVDQTWWRIEYFVIRPSEYIHFRLRKKTRKFRVGKTDCVDSPKLKYFRDYTVANCMTERCLVDKIPLCNLSCQIPVLQLINPNITVSNPCDLKDLMFLYSESCPEVALNNVSCIEEEKCYSSCVHSEFEVTYTKDTRLDFNPNMKISLKYDTNEVLLFEETDRITKVEYLGLISSVLDLWLGITIFTLYGVIVRYVPKFFRYRKRVWKGSNDIEAGEG